MTYFLIQISVLSIVAIIFGGVMGWYLKTHYTEQRNEVKQSSSQDLDLVKGYLADSVKENVRLKLQLKQTEEKVETLAQEEIPGLSGVDFEAYKAFENTVKEVSLRKYLS